MKQGSQFYLQYWYDLSIDIVFCNTAIALMGYNDGICLCPCEQWCDLLETEALNFLKSQPPEWKSKGLSRLFKRSSSARGHDRFLFFSFCKIKNFSGERGEEKGRKGRAGAGKTEQKPSLLSTESLTTLPFWGLAPLLLPGQGAKTKKKLKIKKKSRRDRLADLWTSVLELLSNNRLCPIVDRFLQYLQSRRADPESAQRILRGLRGLKLDFSHQRGLSELINKKQSSGKFSWSQMLHHQRERNH